MTIESPPQSIRRRFIFDDQQHNELARRRNLLRVINIVHTGDDYDAASQIGFAK